LNYVSDTVEGFVNAAASDLAIGKVINLGTGKEISVGDLARLIAKLIGGDLKIEYDAQRTRPTNSEVERLLANNHSASELINWRPAVSLEDGLNKTISWIKNHPHIYKTEMYSI
jgi:dTDP-glucose 4,6-dehydratase